MTANGVSSASRRTYRLRWAMRTRKSLEVTFPYEFVERAARSRGLSVPEFLLRYQAVCEYNSDEEVLYKIEEIPKEVSDAD